MRRFISICVISFLFLRVHAQEQLQYLKLDEVLDIVRKYHPVALQANLLVENANAELRAARGAFDPAFYVSNETKTFDGKNYYFYTQPELKIPTWYGIELKAGVEDNGGDRLANQWTSGRSSYAGISLPVLRNLIIDERRATLEKAKLFIQQSTADRLNEYNQLLFNAADAYWNWVARYQIYQILSDAVTVNEKRFEFVKKAFIGGDRAPIDTVEALTQLQGFQIQQKEAYLQWIVAGLQLSLYLWQSNEQPYYLPENILPDTTWNNVALQNYPIPSLGSSFQDAIIRHPKLQSLKYKIDALEIDRKLKFQDLLPTLNLNYNFLSSGYSSKGFATPLFQNNYKAGFEFNIPLFQRKARGNYQLAKNKLSFSALQQNQLLLEIENNIKQYLNATLNYQQQAIIAESNYSNLIKLLRAEELKFSIGESTLFIVNNRENKALETLQKLAEVKTKFFKSLIGIQYAAGQLQ